MAGILSIPYLTADGSSFPERSLILFLAAGVILFTLLVATVFLPLFSRNETLKEEHLDQAKLTQAKGKILLAAIQAIRQEMNEENESIAYELIDEYKLRFSNLLPAIQQQSERKDYIEKLTNLRLFGIKKSENIFKLCCKINKSAKMFMRLLKISWITGRKFYRIMFEQGRVISSVEC